MKAWLNTELSGQKFCLKFCRLFHFLVKFCGAKKQLSSLKKSIFSVQILVILEIKKKKKKNFSRFFFKNQDQNSNVHIQCSFQLILGAFIDFMTFILRFFCSFLNRNSLSFISVT